MEEGNIVATTGGTPRKPAPSVPKFRTPTVHEALPYTPLSSIVPFTPDIIQAPIALPRLTPALLSSSDGQQNAKDLLEQLSSGATGAETASKRVQQTLHDVQRLLDPDTLTQFTFRKRRALPQLAQSSEKALQVRKPVLTGFAKMVLDNTNVSYRYLTPESEPDVSRCKNGVMPSLKTPNGMRSNDNAALQANEIVPSTQQRMVAAIIPNHMAPSERKAYQHVQPPEQVDSKASNGVRIVNSDQRQKGTVAVQNLVDLLTAIFDVKDDLDSIDYDAIADPHTAFVKRELGDTSVVTLSHEMQSKLDSALSKVIANGRFADLDIDEMLRTERLCETAVAAVGKLSLRVHGDWNDSDVDDWLSQLAIAESGLAAGRTLMRVMAAGANKKELHSEDYLFHLLEALKVVVERCIIPVVEEPPFSGEKIRGEKMQPPANPVFTIAASNSKAIVSIMNATSKNIRLLGDLLVKTDFDGPSLSTVEYLCKTLIFAENAFVEKDSAVGIQNFESLRRSAMDVLAKIFTKYTDQRQFIFDEILISLEKLPATKQSARQFRLADAKPIQLVSALLMRLVQTSATKTKEALKLHSKVREEEEADANGSSESESEEGDDDEAVQASPSKGAAGATDLASNARSLHQAAQTNAWYIVKVLTKRAATTSKNSDEPFRKLLDIFTEDFLNVLGSSDWPAAELLLRTLTMQMVQTVEGDKSTVPSRTLALELLGTMGAGIMELQLRTRSAAKAVDINASQTAGFLIGLVAQLESSDNDPSELLSFQGPYRSLIQYLEARNTGEDPQLQTARGYHLTEWAWSAFNEREMSVDTDTNDSPRVSKDLQANFKQMFAHPKWLDEQGGALTPTSAEGRLAAMVVTMRSPFCRAFDRIFATLLNSMNSEQSRVKSRSMASVVALLEKDPSILDRNHTVLNYIFRGATDPSSLVRDSALGLIDKCLALRPELVSSVYRRVIERTRDAGTNVRKRALRMLKDMYLRDQSHEVRLAIAEAIISRIEDTEENVIDLARITVEEIWFQPFYASTMDGDGAVEAKLAFAAQAGLFIQIIENNDNLLQVLEALTRRLLKISKTATANVKVCRTLVATLFEGIIDSKTIPGGPSEDRILLTLTVFARASPTLFTTSQLERLEPYTQNLTNTDDLDVYRSAITVLRNVMPHLPMMNPDTLLTLQTTLLKSVTRLQKPELREVAPCLWTIDGMLGDRGNKDRLPNFIISVVHKIAQMRDADQVMDEKTAATLAKLMRIVGEFGNACNFDDHFSEFRKKCTWAHSDSVAGLIVETLCPLTSPKRPIDVRIAAMQAICTISQAWPKQFLRADVINAFELAFMNNVPELKEVLLTGLEGFFIAQEVPDENEDGLELGTGVSSGTERLGRTYVASDHDGASTALAQRFLSHVLRLALASCNESAFISARLVVSINKQGLVHPKESAPALVALETCPNKTVATEAFKEHKSQFQKHESLFEKEYMRAVQQTFEYQHAVIGDAAGCSGSPPTSKMHLTWEVLKMGKAQIRKKFLSNLAQKLDFDPAKIDISSAGLKHLAFVRFCLDNLAFFEYDKVDDLQHLTSALEKIFAGTGSTVAQAIESEILKLRVDAIAGSEAMTGTSETLIPDSGPAAFLDPNRLLQLALSSQILCLIWETRSLLPRMWQLHKYTSIKAKGASSKENVNSKTASRAPNTSSLTENYIRCMAELSTPIDSEHTARNLCSNFVELISVDHEVKIADGDEDADAEAEFMDGYATPSESTNDRKSPSMPPASGGSRGKKRKSVSANGGATPKKRGRPAFGKRRSGSGRVMYDDEDEDDDVDDVDGGWD